MKSKNTFNLAIMLAMIAALGILSVQSVSAAHEQGGGAFTPTPIKPGKRTPTRGPRQPSPTPMATVTSPPACDQAFTFRGRVLDARTGSFIPKLVIVGGAFPAVFPGGDLGEYTVRVPAEWGCYINGISVWADGYEPFFLPYDVNSLIYYGEAPDIYMVPENYTPTPTATSTATPYSDATLPPTDTPTPTQGVTGTVTPTSTATATATATATP